MAFAHTRTRNIHECERIYHIDELSIQRRLRGATAANVLAATAAKPRLRLNCKSTIIAVPDGRDHSSSLIRVLGAM